MLRIWELTTNHTIERSRRFRRPLAEVGDEACCPRVPVFMSSSDALVARRGATLAVGPSYLNAKPLEFMSKGSRKNVAGYPRGWKGLTTRLRTQEQPQVHGRAIVPAVKLMFLNACDQEMASTSAELIWRT